MPTSATPAAMAHQPGGECRHWIESITTLCTPHDGSQYDTKVYQNIGDLAQYAMGIIGSVAGANVNKELRSGLQARSVDAVRQQRGLIPATSIA